MNYLDLDDIDFVAYEAETEASTKILPPRAFREAVVASLDPAVQSGYPYMFSAPLETHLRFRPGEVTVWAGYNGAKKSMAVGQLALDLAHQKQPCLIASLEMLPERTIARMLRQASAKVEPGAVDVDRFNDFTDNLLWIFNHVGKLTPARALAVMRYAAKELGVRHMMLDSWMMVCESEEHYDGQKALIESIVRFAQEQLVHLHLVAHCRKPHEDSDRPPNRYDIRGTSSITDLVHNVVTVWANSRKERALEKDPHDEEAKRQPDIIITVDKQRNGAFRGKLHAWFDEATLRISHDRTSQVLPYEFMQTRARSEP